MNKRTIIFAVCSTVIIGKCYASRYYRTAAKIQICETGIFSQIRILPHQDDRIFFKILSCSTVIMCYRSTENFHFHIISSSLRTYSENTGSAFIRTIAADSSTFYIKQTTTSFRSLCVYRTAFCCLIIIDSTFLYVNACLVQIYSTSICCTMSTDSTSININISPIRIYSTAFCCLTVNDLTSVYVNT